MKIEAFGREISVFSRKLSEKERIPDGEPHPQTQDELNKIREKVKIRTDSARKREARGLINLAFFLGEQDVAYEGGILKRGVSEAVEHYASDTVAQEGSLQALDKMQSVKREMENLLVGPTLKTIYKMCQTEFRYTAKPVSNSEEDRIKAKGAEKFARVMQRPENLDFSRSRQTSAFNVMLDGGAFVWPIYNASAGPRRVIRKVSELETPFPVVDERGQPILNESGKPLYHQTKGKKDNLIADTSYVREGELQLNHIMLKDVLVPSGYTWLDDCPNFMVRTAVPKDALDQFKDTAKGPNYDIEKVKERVKAFAPNNFTMREEMLSRLQTDPGASFNLSDGTSGEKGDMELVMLYHYFEKPNELYPEGRWLTFVFGGEQYAYGGEIYCLQEFTLPNAGAMGYPVVEISGPKIPGRFQGLTLIEFAIPAQIRHNKLLSQRMEKYARAGEATMLQDKNFSYMDVSRLPGLASVWRYDSKARGEKPDWIQPPNIPSELFQEDISPQVYIEKLYNIFDFARGGDKTATQVALMAQQSEQWLKDYGIYAQARAYGRVAFWLIWLFKEYQTYGKYGQLLNDFNQWERQLFLRSQIDCADISVDEKSLIAQDQMVMQEKIKLALQIDPDYFKTPDGKKIMLKALALDEALEGSERSQDRSNAVAENGEFYTKLMHSKRLELDKQPVPDEDDISHIVEHLGILTAPVIYDLPENARKRYVKAVVGHCVAIHKARLEKKQSLLEAQGFQKNPIYSEYIVRISVAAEEIGLVMTADAKQMQTPSEEPPPPPPGGVVTQPQDLLELVNQDKGGESSRLPAAMLISSIANKNQAGSPPQTGPEGP